MPEVLGAHNVLGVSKVLETREVPARIDRAHVARLEDLEHMRHAEYLEHLEHQPISPFSPLRI